MSHPVPYIIASVVNVGTIFKKILRDMQMAGEVSSTVEASFTLFNEGVNVEQSSNESVPKESDFK